MIFRRYKDWSISLKITLLIIISVLPFILIYIFKIAPSFTEKSYNNKKETLRELVTVMHSVLVNYDQKVKAGVMTLEEAQRTAIKDINSIKYGENSYFFAYDLNGIEKISGVDSLLTERARLDLTDPDGVKIIMDMINICKKDGEGFVAYKYPKPGESIPKGKISFCKMFEPWGWFIGSGIYVDTLEEQISEYNNKRLMGFLGAALVAVILGFLLSMQIIKSLKKITNMAREIREGNFQTIIVLDQKDEIGILAEAFNALANSFKEFALATDIAKIGIWDWDIAGDQILWAGVMYEIYGISKKTSITYDQWLNLIHPEDLKLFENSIRFTKENKTQDYIEYRIMRPDGSLRYIHAAHGTFTGKKGELIRLVGLNIDITEKVKTENELREALIRAEEANAMKTSAMQKLSENEELFRTTFENANVGVCLLAPDGKYLKVNTALCQILKYSEAELLKMSFLDVTFEEDRMKSIYFIKHNNEIKNYEKRYVRKDAKIIWVYVSSAVIVDGNGKEKYYISYVQDITDRKNNEKELTKHRERLEELITKRTAALKETESKFRAVIDRATDCIMIFNTEGKIVELNKGACDKLGYNYNELLKLNMADIDAKNTITTIMKHLSPAVNKNPVFIESVYLRKDSSMFPVEINVNQFSIGEEEYIVGIARDITERKKNEKQIQKLSQAVIQSPAMVVITDRNGNIEFVNPAFSKITGYSFDEAVSSNTRLLKSGFHKKQFYQNLWNTILSGREWNGEFCNKKRSGEWYWEQASIAPIKNDFDEITHFISVKMDITESKALIKTLEAAKKVAEDATKIKAKFMANMSHEIRTPMNAIMGLTQLVLRTDMTSKQKDYLEKILRSSQSLLGIINDILDFSKIEAGKLRLENIEFQFDEVLDHVKDIIASKVQKKGLELLYQIDSNVPSYLIGDPLRLGQILINLCGNAVKFTAKGEIIIAVKTLEESDDSVKLQISVKDTGIGIKPEDLGKLFEAFSQTDSSITRKFGGTGLGLSITKNLTKLFGGEIWVDSIFGKGSAFHFTAVFGASQKNEKKMMAIPIDLRGIKVIICDDNKSSRDILKERLELFSFETEAVISGKELIKVLKNNKSKPYNLIVVDYDLPEENGIEVCRFIAEENLASEAKVILTAPSYGEDEVINATEENGISAFLEKPMTPSSLYDTIMRAFGLDKEAGHRHKKSFNINYYSKKIEMIKGAKILLAEDDEINQQVAVELLESMGMRVTVAVNGIEVLEKLSNDEYDLILMDLHMPEMDGYTASEKIRKIKELDYLPVLAMTADAVTGVKDKCIDSGMQGFLTKPININELFSALVKWIKPYKREQAEIKTKESNGRFNIPEIDGIELERGLNTVNGNKKLYLDLLSKFVKNYTGFEKKMKSSIEENDMELAIRLAHTLKGVCANIGAFKLREDAVALEENLKAGGNEREQELIDNLTDDLYKLLESVDAALKSIPEPDNAIKTHHSREELQKIIDETENMIMEYSPDALPAIEKISFPRECMEDAEGLTAALKAYDFAKALNYIRNVKNLVKNL